MPRPTRKTSRCGRAQAMAGRAIAQPVDLPAGRQGAFLTILVMYFVYIIQSKKDRKFYTGITNNLERRLHEHNKGKTSTLSTMNRGPFELIYSEHAIDRRTARARERFLKSGAGREFRDKVSHIPR
ncbi:MAG: GIY-YIG nuclease family protein [Candidatus Zambryskibacteria bacterium]|nr:GIY-YIG nuclease family protein [Candidatus Zambryskibacteria bacterium]